MLGTVALCWSGSFRLLVMSYTANPEKEPSPAAPPDPSWAAVLCVSETIAANSAHGTWQRSGLGLSKLRFSLGSTFGLCLGAAGAGVVVGTLVRD
jgi:hypothetical protein